MVINGTTIVQWVGTVIAGIFSWLMYHYSRSLDSKFEQHTKEDERIDKRVDGLESRLNIGVPKSVEDLRKEMRDMDDRVSNIATDLVAVKSQVKCNYDAFIQRVDRLEDNIPALIEAAWCRMLLKYPTALSVKQANKED